MISAQEQKNFLKRSITNGWQSVLRNKFLSLATILIIGLILFVFNLVLALGFASDSVITNVGKKLDIRVEMKEVENYTIQTFIQTLKKHPQVKEVVLFTKEEALKQFQREHAEIVSFIIHYQLENPLPNFVRIVPDRLESNEDLIAFLKSPQFSTIIEQDELINDPEQEKRNEKILNISKAINRLSLWLVAIFALVGVLIIFNTINLNIHNHEKEIQIMKLVGAKYSFIRGGFILEGIAFAITGLLISVVFSRLILAYLTKNLAVIVSNDTLLYGLNAILLHFEDNFWITLSWQILMVGLAGLLSSYIAIELYLRKENAF